MPTAGPLPQRLEQAILTERFGPLRTLAAVMPVCRAALFEPRAFFSAINDQSRITNALAFLAATLGLYVVVQIVFEQALITFAGYETQTVIAYYADTLAAYGLPLSSAAGFLAALLHTIATDLAFVIVNAAAWWIFVQAFAHLGKIASLKVLTIASLYASGALMLALCVLSLPAAYLDGRVVQTIVGTEGTSLNALARFATGTGLFAKYEAIFFYLYLRSISFTTNLRLHWGFIFTILLAYAVTFAAQL
jgi:hypothetical protein